MCDAALVRAVYLSASAVAVRLLGALQVFDQGRSQKFVLGGIKVFLGGGGYKTVE